MNADNAIGEVLEFMKNNPNTLFVTAADSEAGGLEVSGYEVAKLDPNDPLPASDANGAPMDGRDGTNTLPFMTTPDKNGKSFPFRIDWSCFGDVSGSVVARAHCLNAEQMKGKIDTQIFIVICI